MTREEFLTELQDILERDEEITEDMDLADIDEWDSLASMGVMAFFNKAFSIRVTPAELREIKTVRELIEKAGL